MKKVAEKKIAIVTIADLGSLRNLKTDQTMAILSALNRFNLKIDVFCRDYRDFKHPNIKRILPFGRLIPRGFVLLKKIIPYFPGDTLYQAMMDDVMSRTIQRHGPYKYALFIDLRFFRTIKEAHLGGATTISYEGINHPAFLNCIDRELGQNQYANLAKRSYEAIKFSDYILSLSEFVKDTYIKEGFTPKNVFAIPTGADTEKFFPSNGTSSKFRVISVANYSYRKGIQYLLKAWREMNLDNSELLIIGNPVGEMKKLVEEYCKHQNNIIRIPFTKNIVEHYQRASIFVLPSLIEGSAKVTYEAMACGLPVICTAETGSVVQDGYDGYIIPRHNVDKIKEKILLFYNNPETITKMGARARKKVVQSYQWKHFSDRVHGALKEILY